MLWLAPEQYAILPSVNDLSIVKERFKIHWQLQDIRGIIDEKGMKLLEKNRDLTQENTIYAYRG